MSDDRTRISQRFVGADVGTQLSGIYELDARIATGGMGEVYRGHNIQTGDAVAIKIVLPEFAHDQTILSLFRKEASILNHLSHDAVVRYHVFSIDPGIGRPYLAMEFVDGESLFDVMRRGPMPVDEVRRLCHRLAAGLSAVHEAGAIHRDLSPDNIILPGGRVERAKIVDFGIARSETVGGGTLIDGKFAGKYNYVSPEQLGLFGGQVSAQSDIYSLGLVLAAVLCGKPVDMSGSQLDVVEKRRSVPDLSGIDEGFRPLIEAMLQPLPADRPQNMAEIAAMTRGDADASLTLPPGRRAEWQADDGGWQGAEPSSSLRPQSSMPPRADGRSQAPGVASAPGFVEHVRPRIPSAERSQRPAATEAEAVPPAAGGRKTGLVAAAASLVVVAGLAGAYWVGVFGSSGTPAPESGASAALTPAPQAPDDSVPQEQAPPPDEVTDASRDAPVVPEPTVSQQPAVAPIEPQAPPPAEPAAEPPPAPAESSAAARLAEALAQKPAGPAPAAGQEDAAVPALPAPTQPAVAEARPETDAAVPAPENPAGPPEAQNAPAASAEPALELAEPAPAPAEPVKAPSAPTPAPAEAPPVAAQAAAAPQPAPGPEPAPQPAPAVGTAAPSAGAPPAAPLQPVETAAPVPAPTAPAPLPMPAQAAEAPSSGGTAAANSGQAVAMNVPKPDVPAGDAIDGVAQRIAWLRSYSGGDCFFASATAATDKSIEIEGFGTAVDPFARLEGAFQAKFAIEPEIAVRLIEASQCPVVDFLESVADSGAEKPELVLDRTSIPDGSALSGVLRTEPGLKSAMLLVDHKGMMFNLDDRVVVAGGQATFNIPIGLGATDRNLGKPVPQLVLVVTGPSALQAAEFSTPLRAEEVLPKILSEIRKAGKGFSATAKYFRLGG